MNSKIYPLLFSFLFIYALAFAQQRTKSLPQNNSAAFDHVDPPNWWSGMENPFLQIMFHGKNISDAKVSVDYPGVTLEQVHLVENRNYLFVDLNIGHDAAPGDIPIKFTFSRGKSFTYHYPLLAKNDKDNTSRAMGVSAKDFIYLLMPDRFSDGDTTNDRVPGMQDQTLNRDSMYYRHGGDLQGVINHLDYFNDLGITALWLNPVIENDEPKASYHGYSFTDNYKIDPRLGSNEQYKQFVNEAHNHQLKVVQDIVLNHVGDQHWTVKDLPMKSWLNQWPQYTNTTFRESPLFDPYASALDKKIVSDGWFVPSMPDLNQRNPFVANYLTQNAIWWVEYAGIDAYRIDTYIYCDLDFLNHFNTALLKEFPKLHIFGETWVHGVSAQAYFTKNNFDIPFKSNLPGATDFQLNFAIKDALTQSPGWTEGLIRIYLTLAKDFVYADPTKNVVFLDNHDMDRFLSTVDGNIEKYKSGFAWLLTTRGIPQMYYGDEILMKGKASPDGLVREDFHGGWRGDPQNAFSASGRTQAQNDMFHFISKLAHYRMQSTALQDGKLMQYLPEDNIYVYFRYDDKHTVMIIMNGNDQKKSLSTERFRQRIQGFTRAKNIITDEIISHLDSIDILPNQTLVLELQR